MVRDNSYILTQSNAPNKKHGNCDMWTFDMEGTRKLINKMRAKVKPKFARKKKKGL